MITTATKLDLSQQITCSPAQACAALAIGKTTLYELINDGSVRSIKHGKSRLIICESLFDWVAAMEEQSIMDRS